tara:strand:- start:463 stop:669 length:207 start_codon:yes stop_codon:yes gene_type:complete
MYQILLGQLIEEYVSKNRGDISEKVEMYLEVPPAEWINERLEQLEQDWRVRAVDHNREFEIFEPARWG